MGALSLHPSYTPKQTYGYSGYKRAEPPTYPRPPPSPPASGGQWLATSPVHFRALVNHKQARTNIETPWQGVSTVHAAQEFLNLTPMPLIPSQEGTSQIPLLRGARGVF